MKTVEQEKKEETYTLSARCYNCGHMGEVTFPNGISAHLQKCPVCGCREFTPMRKGWGK